MAAFQHEPLDLRSALELTEGADDVAPLAFPEVAGRGVLVADAEGPSHGVDGHAAVGQALLNAAQLAIFDVADDSLALIARDARGTPGGAAEAARSALDEGATLILGPLFAASVRAAGPVAETRGVHVIGFSNDVSVAGGNVFVMGITPAAQVLRVVDRAYVLEAGRLHMQGTANELLGSEEIQKAFMGM